MPKPLTLGLPVALALALAACGRVSETTGAQAPSPALRSLALTSGATYRLQNACSSGVLDVAHASPDDGTPVVLWSNVNAPEQRWKVERQDDGSYALRSLASGKVLDVNAWGTGDGTAVQQWSWNGGANQRVKIIELGDGYAKLSPQHAPNKTLDVAGASTSDGARIQLWDDNGTCAQRWKFLPVGSAGPTPTRGALLGVYRGNDAASVRQFEDWLGRPVDAVLGYTGGNTWEKLDPGWQINMAQFLGGTGRRILWSMPMTPDGSGAAGFREAASGARDDLYRGWARQLLAARGGDADNIYVRTTWELGGEWFPWTGAAQDDPEAFRAAWRHFAGALHAVSPRFKLVWDVVADRPDYGVENDYPGDGAVDVISQDVYWNPQWEGNDPDAAFERKLGGYSRGLNWLANFAAEHGKPLAISEWGVPGGLHENGDWDGRKVDGARFIDLLRRWMATHDVLYATYWDSEAGGYNGLLSDNDPPAAAAELKQLYQEGAAPRSGF